MNNKSKRSRKVVFVDAFAGCGGLSLGLMQAGLTGLFAIEHDKFAFETLRANLLAKGARHKFSWPSWLPKKPISIDDLLDAHRTELKGLASSIDLLVGGPPCQGFSSAGRRRHDDPRNQLFASYLDVVSLLKPRAVLIENVRGFTVNFEQKYRTDNYAEKLRKALEEKYEVYEELLNLSDFGVPQARTRYFLIAFDRSLRADNPFALLRERLPTYLRSLGLSVPVSAFAAISDLEVARGGTRPSSETEGFNEIRYTRPLTKYQKLMGGKGVQPGDLRLARHSKEIEWRFKQIIEWSHAEGRLNTSMSQGMRTKFRLKKVALRVLDPDRPSPTVTSMPDDLLHYREPRTLTVRENARLQSFPDWFAFKGKYTTGGHLRRHEVPRFTQVANAVPPLAARAIGEVLIQVLVDSKTARHSSASSRAAKSLQQPSEVSA
jgi:DNA (cytosine-5)-methyltransferase 1